MPENQTEIPLNTDAAAAVVRLVNIQDIARSLLSDLMLCFGDLTRPYGSSYFEVADGIKELEEIKDLADGAIKSLQKMSGGYCDPDPDKWPPRSPENIEAEYGPNSPPW